ncbi:MAG: glycosyltransferase family 39 protein [Verrucomicrobiia bacterium]
MKHYCIVAVVLLVVMGALMIGPARQDSATVDETTFLGAGYTYWTGHRYYLVPDHSPFGQMLPALPLLAMDVRLSPNAQALLDKRSPYTWAVPWYGPPRAIQELYPQGRNDWYFVATPESQLFGQMFVYDGTNDGDWMMLSGRLVQILLTIGVGLVIFLWLRRATGNELPALFGLALWVFNPHALAYGHLITTDIGGTMGFVGALYTFALFLDKPTGRIAGLCGAATALALLLKYTAALLVPIYLVLAFVYRRNISQSSMRWWKLFLIMIAAFWSTLLVAYFPYWSPALPLPDWQATALGVPKWFQAFRVLLIPRDFFKVIALKLCQSKWGHEGYLFGEWSAHGWWYYFPVVFFLKSPMAFIILSVGSGVVFIKRFKSAPPLELVPWVASVAYLLFAMTSKVNVGVRHFLPVVPLLCIGAGCAFSAVRNSWLKWAAYVLIAWQTVVTLLAYPLYLQFFSEAVGGSQNGYKYLLDSNYDWGQDAKRLKTFLQERGINHVYLNYFGTQYNVEYLKIPNTRVNAEQARQIQEGYLVVSVSELMRPEWTWLRESRQPIARVAHTLFVYQIQ